MTFDTSAIGSTSFSDLTSNISSANNKKLTSKISNLDTDKASDEELMDACKDFETYLVEQVVNTMKKTVDVFKDDSEEENDYLNYFGDYLYKDYAEKIVDSGGVGLAKRLYESMKR